MATCRVCRTVERHLDDARKEVEERKQERGLGREDLELLSVVVDLNRALYFHNCESSRIRRSEA